MSGNCSPWVSVADLVARDDLALVFPQRQRQGAARASARGSVADAAAINFGGRGEPHTTVPVGNTGTTFERGEA